MKIKVLAVDDNAVQVDLVKKYFNGSNKIEVVGSASDGNEVVNLLNSNFEFDIMLLDLVMPNMDGLALLEYMKENNINKKVIVLSAFTMTASGLVAPASHIDTSSPFKKDTCVFAPRLFAISASDSCQVGCPPRVFIHFGILAKLPIPPLTAPIKAPHI